MAGASERDGGCLCGGVRFRARGKPLNVAHCHCASCRRATGSAFSTFADYPSEQVEIGGEDLQEYASSPDAVRLFCRACGSAIAYKGHNRPDEIHMHAGVFDAPEALVCDGQVIGEENVMGRLHWVSPGEITKTKERG